MKTNIFTKDKIDEMIDKIKPMSLYQADAEILRPLIGVDEYTLKQLLKQQKKNMDLDNFIREGLNISDEEIQMLRNRFLKANGALQLTDSKKELSSKGGQKTSMFSFRID